MCISTWNVVLRVVSVWKRDSLRIYYVESLWESCGAGTSAIVFDGIWLRVNSTGTLSPCRERGKHWMGWGSVCMSAKGWDYGYVFMSLCEEWSTAVHVWWVRMWGGMCDTGSCVSVWLCECVCKKSVTGCWSVSTCVALCACVGSSWHSSDCLSVRGSLHVCQRGSWTGGPADCELPRTHLWALMRAERGTP